MNKEVRVLAFSSCGHCPLAIVKLQGKFESMKVYCPLQKDEEGLLKVVYKTSLIDKLHPDCPLQTIWQLQEALKGKSGEATKAFVEHCNRILFVYSYGQGTNTTQDLDDALPNRKRKEEAKECEVWCEGFAATGEAGKAFLIGTAIASNFPSACKAAIEKLVC